MASTHHQDAGGLWPQLRGGPAPGYKLKIGTILPSLKRMHTRSENEWYSGWHMKPVRFLLSYCLLKDEFHPVCLPLTPAVGFQCDFC